MALALGWGGALSTEGGDLGLDIDAARSCSISASA